MELSWLETFLAVVDRRGFTAAAEHVHRSQSRVSAHIAALERELGVRLIDRTHRPATVTTAGQVLAGHAREIVAGVGSARSAIDALRAMDDQSLSVLTTPSIGAALFPGVLAELAVRFPDARVALSSQGWHDVEGRFPAEGVVIAVLPTLAHPLTPGLCEHPLWQERARLVVPPDHELAGDSTAVAPDRLVRHPLVVRATTSAEAEPEVVPVLAARGLAVRPRVTVDTPQALVAMARAGVGVGVAYALALDHADTSGLVVRDIDGPDMVREVAAYWYEVLLVTGVGQALRRAVLAAPVPRGATEVPRSAA